jgi:hypothetical protein
MSRGKVAFLVLGVCVVAVAIGLVLHRWAPKTPAATGWTMKPVPPASGLFAPATGQLFATTGKFFDVSSASAMTNPIVGVTNLASFRAWVASNQPDAKVVVPLPESKHKADRARGRQYRDMDDEQKAVFEKVKQELATASHEKKLSLLNELWAADICNPAVLDLVREAMQDPDPQVQQAALNVVVDYASADILPIVEAALAGTQMETRVTALNTLCYVEDAQVTNLLIRAVHDSEPDVQETALKAVEKQADTVKYPVLAEGLLVTSNLYVNQTALGILQKENSKSGFETILRGLQHPDSNSLFEYTTSIFGTVGKDFSSYEDAVDWWRTNKSRYGADMTLIEQ